MATDEPGGPFPFCSRRCRDADLNRWFTEGYAAPVEGPRVVEEALGSPALDEG